MCSGLATGGKKGTAETHTTGAGEPCTHKMFDTQFTFFQVQQELLRAGAEKTNNHGKETQNTPHFQNGSQCRQISLGTVSEEQSMHCVKAMDILTCDDHELGQLPIWSSSRLLMRLHTSFEAFHEQLVDQCLFLLQIEFAARSNNEWNQHVSH